MTKYAKFKIYKILQIFHGHIPKFNLKSLISFEIKNKKYLVLKLTCTFTKHAWKTEKRIETAKSLFNQIETQVEEMKELTRNNVQFSRKCNELP